MLLVEGFQKFVGIPFGIPRIFESLMAKQIGAKRRKNRSIQVSFLSLFFFVKNIINPALIPSSSLSLNKGGILAVQSCYRFH
jgi:hypothetical protein